MPFWLKVTSLERGVNDIYRFRVDSLKRGVNDIAESGCNQALPKSDFWVSINNGKVGLLALQTFKRGHDPQRESS